MSRIGVASTSPPKVLLRCLLFYCYSFRGWWSEGTPEEEYEDSVFNLYTTETLVTGVSYTAIFDRSSSLKSSCGHPVGCQDPKMIFRDVREAKKDFEIQAAGRCWCWRRPSENCSTGPDFERVTLSGVPLGLAPSRRVALVHVKRFYDQPRTRQVVTFCGRSGCPGGAVSGLRMCRWR